MLINDLKKGDRVILENGWFATVADNRKGGIRKMLTVEGYATETGDVYVDEIMAYVESDGEDSLYTELLMTVKQEKDMTKVREQMKALFGE